ncbi:MAG TPA: DNA repair protein RecN [Acidimicrobiales bacterium]
MLTELRVRDLGVIEDLTITFGPGMTALTGETGAGKTLVVEALQLVLGGKAHASMVRRGSTEAIIEARFVGDGEDDEEIIVTRSVPAEGRARAWINGRMSPANLLAEIVAPMLEIHGQHEHQSLTTPAAQRNVLDAFAGTDVSEIQRLRTQLREFSAALTELGGDTAARAREADVLRYQVDEIAAAQLQGPDEEDELRIEEERLADASAYREAAEHALNLLSPTSSDDESGVLTSLGQAVNALTGRDAFATYRDRLTAAALELTDVAQGLRDEVDGWEDDPGRLVDVGERRRLLAELRRKYGHDLAEVIAFAKEATTRLEDVLSAEGRAEALEGERAQTLRELAAAEDVVRTVRTEAAQRFADAVGARLGDLAMGGARIEVRVSQEGSGEPVEIALGANIGEAVLPLAKAASGGELARSMLAIRLVGLGGPQTMVFDEVDAGVGGAAALSLGTALSEVSQSRQVLVVTHLAQVAAKADQQVSVLKSEVEGRTVTSAVGVQGEDRVVELSRMLSGHPDSDAARAHARELLGMTGTA